MKSFDRGNQLLATGLAGLAGFVDATGFIATGGFFLSFMSGNSTRLGVGLIASGEHAALAASLVGAFVVGVMGGTLTGRAAGRHHRPAVLLLVGAALAIAAALAGGGHFLPALLATALAMGAENTVFEADGEVRISLTYMTGNLVKIGQRLAGVLLGRGRWEWLPFLALWLAMLGGAIAGASLWPHLGLAGLWLAAAAAVVLAAASRLIEARASRPAG
ncbi:MAG: YoaK family protein [Polymorphobacter sp.]